jgi:hypothetical protein
MSTLFEIIEDNIILASNEDLGLILTANGSYFQVWRQLDRGAFECIEALHLGSRMLDDKGNEPRDGLDGLDTAKLWAKAELVLNEYISEHYGNEAK